MAEETGAAQAFIGFNLQVAAELLKDVAGRISSIQGSIPQTSSEGTSALIYKEPYGTILAIAPWNAPYILGLRAILYPLAAGNTVCISFLFVWYRRTRVLDIFYLELKSCRGFRYIYRYIYRSHNFHAWILGEFFMHQADIVTRSF